MYKKGLLTMRSKKKWAKTLSICVMLVLLLGCQKTTSKKEKGENKNTSALYSLSLDGKNVALCGSIKDFLGSGWKVIYQDAKEVAAHKEACETVENNRGNRLRVCGMNKSKEPKKIEDTTMFHVSVRKKHWDKPVSVDQTIEFGSTLKDLFAMYGYPEDYIQRSNGRYYIEYKSKEGDMFIFELNKDKEVDVISIGDQYYSQTFDRGRNSVCDVKDDGTVYKKKEWSKKPFPVEKTQLQIDSINNSINNRSILIDGHNITGNDLVKDVVANLDWEAKWNKDLYFVRLTKGNYTMRIDYDSDVDISSAKVLEVSVHYRIEDEKKEDTYYPTVYYFGKVKAATLENLLDKYGGPTFFSSNEMGGTLSYNYFGSSFDEKGKITSWGMSFVDYDIYEKRSAGV